VLSSSLASLCGDLVAGRVEHAEGVEDEQVGEGRGHALLTFRPVLASQGVALTPNLRSSSAALPRKLDREAKAGC
jgi:hypothetical protein